MMKCYLPIIMSNSMKVYIAMIHRGTYTYSLQEEERIVGIFSTRELAQRALDNHYYGIRDDRKEVIEFDLDESS